MAKELASSLIDKSLIIVPCYNAENTILETIDGILKTGFNNIVVGDDKSNDNTVSLLKKEYPQIPIIIQDKNLGYGGNQKILYQYGINQGFDYMIMIHGDFQYTPNLIPSMASLLHFANYDFVFGSRILGGNALKGGMPLYKYLFNRILTLIQNICTGYKLSEYHSGLRGFNVAFLKKVDFTKFSNNFIFDNQIILEFIFLKAYVGEVSCITKYDYKTSSINFKSSMVYGLGILKETANFLFRKLKTTFNLS